MNTAHSWACHRAIGVQSAQVTKRAQVGHGPLLA
jgi:hypothetical protein